MYAYSEKPGQNAVVKFHASVDVKKTIATTLPVDCMWHVGVLTVG